MNLNRRTLLTGLAAGGAGALIRPARAQSWQAQFPELVFAVVPAENASGVSDRFAPFVAYLSNQLGTKVTLRIANDYAAVIEGQRAGNIHIGYHGPASFARARVAGVQTEAFVIDVNNDGSKGYYSVFYVLAKSPYQKIEDMKGKNLGLVDPNSGSGYNMPMFTLDKRGITPDAYFGKTLMTGSHENAVLALSQGTVDVAANWFFAALSFFAAFLDAAKNDKAAFERLTDGKGRPWEAVDTAAYDDTIKLIQFVDRLRRKAA